MKIILRLGMSAIVLISGRAARAEEPSARISGSYVCLNNPAPECRNPDRQITPTFACINNPSPECRHPGRPRTGLEPGSWSCLMNQNVQCDNTIRYSVEDRQNWTEHFERTSERSPEAPSIPQTP